MFKQFVIIAVTLVFAAVVQQPAAAQPADADLDAKREKARPLAIQGFELLEAGRYNEAIAKLEEAERIFHAPTHLLYIGRARKKLGELLTAYETFVDILIEDIPNYAPAQFQKAKREAQTEADALRAQIATVMVRVSGVPSDDVTVMVDDMPIASVRLAHPIGVTEGAHTVEARADDAESVSKRVEGVVGQTVSVELAIERSTSETPTVESDTGDDGFPVLGTVILAVGTAALVAGAITGVLTLNKASEIKEKCTGTTCPLAQQSETDDAKLIGNVSTAMFIAGGVLAATGIVLIIVGPTSGGSSEAEVGLRIGPSSAAFVGSF